MHIHKPIPFLSHMVQAGFPSPADDYQEKTLDINDLFQVDEATSFYVRATGESMKNAGIMSGDILCVRKDIDPVDGDIVIAAIDNEFTVKTFRNKKGYVYFQAANEEYPDILPLAEQDVQIWGVVTGFARVLKRKKS